MLDAICTEVSRFPPLSLALHKSLHHSHQSSPRKLPTDAGCFHMNGRSPLVPRGVTLRVAPSTQFVITPAAHSGRCRDHRSRNVAPITTSPHGHRPTPGDHESECLWYPPVQAWELAM